MLLDVGLDGLEEVGVVEGRRGGVGEQVIQDVHE